MNDRALPPLLTQAERLVQLANEQIGIVPKDALDMARDIVRCAQAGVVIAMPDAVVYRIGDVYSDLRPWPQDHAQPIPAFEGVDIDRVHEAVRRKPPADPALEACV